MEKIKLSKKLLTELEERKTGKDVIYRDEWIPTKEAIDKYFVPNLPKTADYLVWLLDTAPEPEKIEEKEGMEYLKQVIELYIILEK